MTNTTFTLNNSACCGAHTCSPRKILFILKRQIRKYISIDSVFLGLSKVEGLSSNSESCFQQCVENTSKESDKAFFQINTFSD